MLSQLLHFAIQPVRYNRLAQGLYLVKEKEKQSLLLAGHLEKLLLDVPSRPPSSSLVQLASNDHTTAQPATAAGQLAITLTLTFLGPAVLC